MTHSLCQFSRVKKSLEHCLGGSLKAMGYLKLVQDWSPAAPHIDCDSNSHPPFLWDPLPQASVLEPKPSMRDFEVMLCVGSDPRYLAGIIIREVGIPERHIRLSRFLFAEPLMVEKISTDPLFPFPLQ